MSGFCGDAPTVAWDTGDLAPDEVYKLLTGSIVPRPVAWVAARSAAGVANIAPFSFFTVASRQPPVIAISVGQPADPAKAAKDTLVCLRETGEFTVNIVTLPLLNQFVATSVEYPADVDEFQVAQLTPAVGDVVSAPRIAEAPIAMECRVRQLLSVGSDVLVLGQVVRFHVRAGVVDDRLRIDPLALQPVGRMAGPVFCTQMTLLSPAVSAAASHGNGR